MVKARDVIADLLSRKPYRAVGAGAVTIPAVGDLRDIVRDGMHMAGTVRMGAADDSESVVDSECRVLGVDGLRVIDASIMPEITRANPNLTVIMMAEHMAARLAG